MRGVLTAGPAPAAIRRSVQGGVARARGAYSLIRYPQALDTVSGLGLPGRQGRAGRPIRPARVANPLGWPAGRYGAALGLGLGTLWALQMVIARLGLAGRMGNGMLTGAVLTAWLLLTLAVGVYHAEQTGRIGQGVLAGFCGGLVSGLVVCCTGLALALVAPGLPAAPAATEPAVVQDIVGMGGYHLVGLGMGAGAALGLLGGLIGKGLTRCTGDPALRQLACSPDPPQAE